MTVSSQTNNVTFVGNGSATAFPLPFRFFSNGDIFAYFIDSISGASTPMVLGTDYTLLGAGEPEVDGNALSLLTTTVPLSNMRGMYVERIMQQLQQTDIVNQGEFFASTHEDVFDRLTMLVQQANANSQGAIRVAIGDPDPQRLAPAAQRANRLLSFDENGQPTAVAPASGSASDLAINLANNSDPNNGAALVGYKGRSTYERLSDAAHINDFDGAIEGQDNSASLAFTQAEASPAKQIFVPQGVWNAGSVSLTKRYYGPGAVISNGSTIGRDYVSVATMPANSVTPGLYYGADLSKVSPTEFIVQSSVDREDLDIPYFDYRLIPSHTRATFRSGQSGYDASIVTPTIVGTNYVFVDDLTPFSVGDLVVIGSYLPNAERKTITLIEESGKLTFDSNFVGVIGTPGVNSIAAVSKSARTNSGVRLTELDVLGDSAGGDFVAETMRISCGATHNPGRNHAFDRTTIGFVGGDAVAYTPGIYIAGTEYMYYDTATPQGFPVSGNIMVIDQVRSFNRTVDDGTFGCVWLGSLYKSEGSLPADACHVIAGKWKRGVDTVLADLGSGKAAVSMASTHRLYWGSVSQPDLDGFRFWGDLLGPIFVEGRTTGGDNLLEVNVGGVDIAKFRSDSLNVKGNINALNNVGGASLTVPTGGLVNLGTNTYITYNGTNILLFKNGAQVASW